MDNMINVIRITTKGEITVEYVKNDLESFRGLIGCEAVECVTPAFAIKELLLPDSVKFYCDEDAWMKKDLKMNTIISSLYAGGLSLEHYILGDIVIVDNDGAYFCDMDFNRLSRICSLLEDIKERLTELGILEI